MKTVEVSAEALRRLLEAVTGPAHYVRELQATRGSKLILNNPIDVLIEEYNNAVNAYNAGLHHEGAVDVDSNAGDAGRPG